MNEAICPCGSGKEFSVCCEPLLTGQRIASTAEQLMRSRYSAYVHGDVDYLIDTTHISQRKHHSRKGIQQWSAENEWLKLEVIAAAENSVEFKAFFKDKKSMLQVHHEKSSFKQEDGKWYFVEGVFGD